MKYAFVRPQLFFICMVLLCSSSMFSDGKLETRTFLNNHLKIKIPAGFNVKNNDEVIEQYRGFILNSFICGGPYSVPAFTITQYRNNLSQDSIEIELKSMQAQWYRNGNGKDPSSKLIASGVKLINGHKVGYMEYVVYDNNYMLDFFTGVDGRYVSFRFICLTEQKKWISAANEILQSLEVK